MDVSSSDVDRFQSALPESFDHLDRRIEIAARSFTVTPSRRLELGAGRLELDPSLQQPFYLTPSEDQRPRTVCQLLLQDVVVMKVGNFPLTETVVQQAQPEQTTPTQLPDVVTLIVSPQDAITLTYLTYQCTPLALRNPGDQSRQATEANAILLSQYNIPVPAKLPYATQPNRFPVAPVLPNDAITTTTE
jgi:pilus assembly protein CpaB